MAFSPDGRLLAGGGEARKVHVIDTDSWEAREAVPVHDAELIQIGWLPDNRTVLPPAMTEPSCFSTPTARSCAALPCPRPSTTNRGTPAWCPTPDDEIVAFNDQWVGLRYPVEPSVWLRDACAIAGRDLTRAGVGPVPAGTGVGTDLHRSGLRPPPAAALRPGRIPGAGRRPVRAPGRG